MSLLCMASNSALEHGMHLHGNVHTQELHLSTRRGWSARQGKRLEVSEPHALAPSLILSHEINEASPLHGVKDADIREADGAVCVSVAAVDDHSLQVRRSPGPLCLAHAPQMPWGTAFAAN